MARYISTFVPGFEETIEVELNRILSRIKILSIYSGLIVYDYGGPLDDLFKVKVVNNTFVVLHQFNKAEITFDKMVETVAKQKNIRFPYNYFNQQRIKSYRVRFSSANQYQKVSMDLKKQAEQTITKLTKLEINRELPDVEFLYLIRNEGIGFFCFLIGKAKGIKIARGELKPQFSSLMVAWAQIKNGLTVLDPCAGSGSILIQVLMLYSNSRVIAGDIDRDKIRILRYNLGKFVARFSIYQMDVNKMTYLKDKSVDCVITDPPWGIYEKINNIEKFYSGMLIECKRVLKKNGKIVILSAKKDELLRAADSESLELIKKSDVLVNGKKAALFMFKISAFSSNSKRITNLLNIPHLP
jgi:tRNA G10  N-methylase Trm11